MANPAQQPTIIGPGVSNIVAWTPTFVTKASTFQTITVSGADPFANQEVNVSNFAFSAGSYTQTSGLSIGRAYVSAANTVSVEIVNDITITNGSALPAAGYYGVVFN